MHWQPLQRSLVAINAHTLRHAAWAKRRMLRRAAPVATAHRGEEQRLEQLVEHYEDVMQLLARQPVHQGLQLPIMCPVELAAFGEQHDIPMVISACRPVGPNTGVEQLAELLRGDPAEPDGPWPVRVLGAAAYAVGHVARQLWARGHRRAPCEGGGPGSQGCGRGLGRTGSSHLPGSRASSQKPASTRSHAPRRPGGASDWCRCRRRCACMRPAVAAPDHCAGAPRARGAAGAPAATGPQGAPPAHARRRAPHVLRSAPALLPLGGWALPCRAVRTRHRTPQSHVAQASPSQACTSMQALSLRHPESGPGTLAPQAFAGLEASAAAGRGEAGRSSHVNDFQTAWVLRCPHPQAPSRRGLRAACWPAHTATCECGVWPLGACRRRTPRP